MRWRSHAVIGALCSVLILYLLSTHEVSDLLVIAIFGALSALTPDLDHEMSKGRKLLDIGFIFSSFAILYWSGCHGEICSPDVSIFIMWLAVLGGYFLLFRFFKPKHRGITHSLVATFVFGMIIYVLLDWKFTVVGVLGYLSHLLADKEIKLI
ncbi:LexA-binding, inner membrane-associated putative hydrolase [Candidatus Bilamarchaeum dharawalense]|uniref:LexA-binding, inner membrane-associated putative hydrolase n=1 Tax=Candidatus Bilamarchaeum dharawalense TaxID=2885759 RepID=A0A5E4LMD0_9ARCH|nr:LexA-binding, inner membrane-associated putative hydrolase [Candidatus Bilamarchaeum dharawalense]